MNITMNGQTRLWSIWPDGAKLYHPAVVIWRMMWNGGKERIILRARHFAADLIFNFVDGMTLEVMGSVCSDPSDYYSSDNRIVYRMTNCKARRKWIPRLIAMSSDEHAPLDVYLEIDCEIQRFKNDRNSDPS